MERQRLSDHIASLERAQNGRKGLEVGRGPSSDCARACVRVCVCVGRFVCVCVCVSVCVLLCNCSSICFFVAQQLVAGTICNDLSSCFQMQVQAIFYGSTMQLCVLREAARRALRSSDDVGTRLIRDELLTVHAHSR